MEWFPSLGSEASEVLHSFQQRGLLRPSGSLPQRDQVAFGGDGNGTPLQYSCLENPVDRGAWWAAVHGVAKSRTRLSNFTFTFHSHALEKEMANPLKSSCLENPRDGRA